MENNFKKIAENIGFTQTGVVKGNSYIIKLDTSDDYAKAYTLLDHSEDLDLTEKSSMSSEYSTVLVYDSGEYTVTLNANFGDDIYNVVIKEDK